MFCRSRGIWVNPKPASASLEARLSDSSWQTPSILSRQDPNDRKDYVYEFWGSTWATLGLLRYSITTSGQP